MSQQPLFFLMSATLLAMVGGGWAAQQRAGSPPGYDGLVALFGEWRAFQKPKITDGVPDYTAAAMAQQRQGLAQFKARLAAIDPKPWPIAQQVDYHIVRAEMNGLDFDHRVLRPWSRNPCFYAVLHESQSDTPAHEGHVQVGAIELWQFSFPLQPAARTAFATELRAIPRILEQAKANLVEDARDLWFLGIRVKKDESEVLARLETTLAQHHADLVPDAQRARRAVDDFRVWLEGKQKTMTASSAIGIENYNWYVRNVHLSPYTWEDERALHEREWARSLSALSLQQNLNRALPRLEPINDAQEYQRRFAEAVSEYVRFLGEQQVVTVRDYMAPALLAQAGRYSPPEARDFFAQINYREPLVMRTHDFHWIDLARMEREPHPSPIRRGPLLYNIWDSRAEGFATAMEEMMMTAGFLETRPRVKELIYILIANRAARGLAGHRQLSGELTLEQALRAAHEGTPYGWLRLDGGTNWGEQRLYLEQPGYGTVYLSGKAQIQKLMADRQHQLGDRFSLRQFMDEFTAAGMIPVSLIRWEMTGLDDEARRIFQEPGTAPSGGAGER
jgi:hypothetical protein